MYYMYCLQDKNNTLYFGYSSNLRRRLQEHLHKKVYTTKKMTSPRLVYYEGYDNETAARNREKKIKQFGSSYNGLIKRLNLLKYDH